jgi:hypothetical protein
VRAVRVRVRVPRDVCVCVCVCVCVQSRRARSLTQLLQGPATEAKSVQNPARACVCVYVIQFGSPNTTLQEGLQKKDDSDDEDDDVKDEAPLQSKEETVQEGVDSRIEENHSIYRQIIELKHQLTLPATEAFNGALKTTGLITHVVEDVGDWCKKNNVRMFHERADEGYYSVTGGGEGGGEGGGGAEGAGEDDGKVEDDIPPLTTIGLHGTNLIDKTGVRRPLEHFIKSEEDLQLYHHIASDLHDDHYPSILLKSLSGDTLLHLTREFMEAFERYSCSLSLFLS